MRLVLHACGGEDRVWIVDVAGPMPQCSLCQSPFAPECKPVEGHAQYLCPCCERWIGLCPHADLESDLASLTCLDEIEHPSAQ